MNELGKKCEELAAHATAVVESTSPWARGDRSRVSGAKSSRVARAAVESGKCGRYSDRREPARPGG